MQGKESQGSNENLEAKQKTPMFNNLGGMKDLLKKLIAQLIVPWYHPAILRKLNVTPRTRILLHGPSGCGKTTLAHAIANETRVPFYQILPGDSEESIRAIFAEDWKAWII